ncbi:hypothetical protein HaLaN_29938, partial [Haematococcus lacustris]
MQGSAQLHIASVRPRTAAAILTPLPETRCWNYLQEPDAVLHDTGPGAGGQRKCACANGRTVVTSHPDGTITCTLADPGFHPAQYSRSRSRSPAATPQARNLTTPTLHNPGAELHSSQARSVMGSEGSGGEGAPRQAQTGLGSRGVVQLRSVGLASRGMAAPMQSSDAWSCMETMELESPKCEVKGESHIRDLKRKAAEVTLGLGAAALLLGYTTGAACAMKHVADGAVTGQWQPLPVLAREITYSVASTTAATFA